MTRHPCMRPAAGRRFPVCLLAGDNVEAQHIKTRLEYLRERREVLFENLRDLNFEFRSGKYPEEDYAAQRAALENEAAETVAEIDLLESEVLIAPASRLTIFLLRQEPHEADLPNLPSFAALRCRFHSRGHHLRHRHRPHHGQARSGGYGRAARPGRRVCPESARTKIDGQGHYSFTVPAMRAACTWSASSTRKPRITDQCRRTPRW